MTMVSTVNIEVKIRNIEKLKETADKCFEVAKIHPYAAKIVIRVDETRLLCKLQRILRCIQKRLQHHLRKKDDKSCFQVNSDER